MSDDDLIRRGDARDILSEEGWLGRSLERIKALPAVTVPDLSDPVVVHLNMLRGTIAKPTIEQIVHLYGSEALQPMIYAAMVEAAKPFADIGVGSDPDYQAVVRIDRDAVIYLRAALAALKGAEHE